MITTDRALGRCCYNLDIKQLNRNKFHKYIRPLFIKIKCEICGSADNLELHHDKQFDELLRESINKLGFRYTEDTKEYSNEELELISLVLLGLQVKCKYYTLCDDCHQKMHEDGGRSIYDKINKENKNKETQGNIDNILIPYLESIIDKKLFDKEQECLKNIFIECNLNFRTMGINSLNKLLHDYNIPYIIIKKRNKDKRWWSINKN